MQSIDLDHLPAASQSGGLQFWASCQGRWQQILPRRVNLLEAIQPFVRETVYLPLNICSRQNEGWFMTTQFLSSVRAIGAGRLLSAFVWFAFLLALSLNALVFSLIVGRFVLRGLFSAFGF